MDKPLDNLVVLLLCGGKGERLQPLTSNQPKPLIEIKGKPILSYLISYFKKYGLTRFVVAVGYKSEKVVSYFKENHRNIEVQIVDSGDADIIDRIRDAARFIRGDFILCYGDTLADVNLHELAAFHRQHADGISVTAYPARSPFGLLEMNSSGKVISFREKPVLDKWINIGFFFFPLKFVSRLQEHNNFVDFLQKQVERGELYGFCHRGTHITVNTLTELQEAEKNIGMFEKTIGG